jgi:hypothetical protein
MCDKKLELPREIKIISEAMKKKQLEDPKN